LLERGTRFVEPCAGGGELVGHLEREGHICVGAYDLPVDARTARYTVVPDAVFITNIPWRKAFEPNKIIVNLSDQRPSWVLLYSDLLFTQHAAPLLSRLRAVVVIGRVKWIPDSKFTGGMENSCWCLFDKPDPAGAVRFIGHLPRAARSARSALRGAAKRINPC
jgi:hypothetical protein